MFEVEKVVIRGEMPTGCSWCEFAVDEEFSDADNPIYCIVDSKQREVCSESADFCNIRPSWCPLVLEEGGKG